MEEQTSFIKNLRAKFCHTRSISQPPVDRNIEWDAVPVEYRPVGHVETRVLKPEYPALQPYIPARYHPNPLRQEIKRASAGNAPLLQLPRPRATWRRSLEDLSPTKKSDWWNDPDIEAQRMTFNIACALPPHYLEQPPPYSQDDDIDDLAKDATQQPDMAELHLPNIYTRERIPFYYDGRGVTPTPGTASSDMNQSLRRGSSPIQGSYNDHTAGSMDATIDGLLSHPMLRVSGPEEHERQPRERIRS
jgi:hypothetical protein